MNTQVEQIRRFVLSKFPLAKKRGVSDDENLLDSGIVDSLGILDLVSFIEQEFNVTVSDDELVPENFKSIRSLAAFVQRKQGVVEVK